MKDNKEENAYSSGKCGEILVHLFQYSVRRLIQKGNTISSESRYERESYSRTKHNFERDFHKA